MEDDIDWDQVAHISDQAQKETRTKVFKSQFNNSEPKGTTFKANNRGLYQRQSVRSKRPVQSKLSDDFFNPKLKSFQKIICSRCDSQNDSNDLRCCMCDNPLNHNSAIDLVEPKRPSSTGTNTSSGKGKLRPTTASSSSLLNLTSNQNSNQQTLHGFVNSIPKASRNELEARPSGITFDNPLKEAFRVDEATVHEYVFPQNDGFPLRSYQKSIVESALMHNTLVVLPTGLGKTFIAAVVMMNYLRWFPKGKVIFMAPTRPLVTQQIEACHGIVGIKEEITAEMLGSVKPAKRSQLWREKRCFYCTPQTAEKDCNSGILPLDDVVLIVVDEAHRATGRYAYTTVVEALHAHSPHFRMLALSATPGKDFNKVQEVVSNLLISRIEYKSESDPDVKPYVFDKMMQVIKVQMTPKCKEIVEQLEGFCKTPLQAICNSGMLPMVKRDIKKVTYAMVLTASKQMTVGGMNPAYFSLMGYVGLLLSLLHLRRLLLLHGLRTMISMLLRKFSPPFTSKNSRAKNVLVNSPQWKTFVGKLQQLSISGQEIGANPKVCKLIEITQEHFARYKGANQRTSVIVFTQYRDSVAEIVESMSAKTDLNVSPFVGQSNGSKSSKQKKDALGSLDAANSENAAIRGQNQKQQQEIVRKFRAGKIDVLVATCIGEEGLDIGSVDLIVSFDALSSPVRMVQRFGRAGRKRSGSIVVLAAEGREMEMLQSGTQKSNRVHTLLRKHQSKISMYSQDRSYLPDDVSPKLSFREIEKEEYRSSQIGGRNLKRRRRKAATSTSTSLELTSSQHELYRKIIRKAAQETIALSLTNVSESDSCAQQFQIPHHIANHSSRSNLLAHMTAFIVAEAWETNFEQDEHFVADFNASRVVHLPAGADPFESLYVEALGCDFPAEKIKSDVEGDTDDRDENETTTVVEQTTIGISSDEEDSDAILDEPVPWLISRKPNKPSSQEKQVNSVTTAESSLNGVGDILLPKLETKSDDDLVSRENQNKDCDERMKEGKQESEQWSIKFQRRKKRRRIVASDDEDEEGNATLETVKDRNCLRSAQEIPMTSEKRKAIPGKSTDDKVTQVLEVSDADEGEREVNVRPGNCKTAHPSIDKTGSFDDLCVDRRAGSTRNLNNLLDDTETSLQGKERKATVSQIGESSDQHVDRTSIPNGHAIKIGRVETAPSSPLSQDSEASDFVPTPPDLEELFNPQSSKKSSTPIKDSKKITGNNTFQTPVRGSKESCPKTDGLDNSLYEPTRGEQCVCDSATKKVRPKDGDVSTFVTNKRSVALESSGSDLSCNTKPLEVVAPITTPDIGFVRKRSTRRCIVDTPTSKISDNESVQILFSPSSAAKNDTQDESQSPIQLKRLRRCVATPNSESSLDLERRHNSNHERSRTGANHRSKSADVQGMKPRRAIVRQVYHEEEAEVSGSDSEDEAIESGEDEDLDGFINDSSQLTMASGHSNLEPALDTSSPINDGDMYRRSLMESPATHKVSTKIRLSHCPILQQQMQKLKRGEENLRVDSANSQAEVIVQQRNRATKSSEEGTFNVTDDFSTTVAGQPVLKQNQPNSTKSGTNRAHTASVTSTTGHPAKPQAPSLTQLFNNAKPQRNARKEVVVHTGFVGGRQNTINMKGLPARSVLANTNAQQAGLSSQQHQLVAPQASTGTTASIKSASQTQANIVALKSGGPSQQSKSTACTLNSAQKRRMEENRWKALERQRQRDSVARKQAFLAPYGEHPKKTSTVNSHGPQSSQVAPIKKLHNVVPPPRLGAGFPSKQSPQENTSRRFGDQTVTATSTRENLVATNNLQSFTKGAPQSISEAPSAIAQTVITKKCSVNQGIAPPGFADAAHRTHAVKKPSWNVLGTSNPKQVGNQMKSTQASDSNGRFTKKGDSDIRINADMQKMIEEKKRRALEIQRQHARATASR